MTTTSSPSKSTCGLSRGKVLYLKDIARHFVEGRLDRYDGYTLRIKK